ncbi:MAG TPA: TolC family protein [Pirellulales bacterium]|jgi:outer membrane protein TolC
MRRSGLVPTAVMVFLLRAIYALAQEQIPAPQTRPCVPNTIDSRGMNSMNPSGRPGMGPGMRSGMAPGMGQGRLQATPVPTVPAVQPPVERVLAPPATYAGADPPNVGKRFLPPPQMPARSPALDYALQKDRAALEHSFTLDALLDLAIRNNPTLRQAQAHISAELGKALEAGLYPNPILQYTGQQIGVRNAQQPQTAGEFQGGLIQQEIVTSRKLALSRQKYILRARISEHLAIAQQFKVLNDVRTHYYRSLAAAEIVRIERELLKTAEDRALTVREMYNVGQARRPEVRQADVALERARLRVLEVDNERQQVFQELMSLVGIAVNCGTVTGQLASCEPRLDFESALTRLWAESPQLAATRAKLSCDQVTVRREQAQWVPNLTFSGGTGYDFQDRDAVAAANMFMDVPLFDRNQGTVRQAQADLARQQAEIQRVELQLRMKLADVYRRYLTADQHIEQYQKSILPETQAAYRELLEGYKANRAEWPDVLDAQHEYFESQMSYVKQLELFRVNEVLLYGYLLHDGLEAAQGPTPPGHIDSVPKPR